MYSPAAMIVFRLLHVLAGVAWAGGAIFLVSVLLPAVRATGPAAAPVMARLSARVPVYMLSLAAVSILSGVALFYRDSSGFSSDVWMHSGPGLAYSVGGTLAIITAIIGAAVTAPTAKRMQAVGAAVMARGGPPTAEETAEIQRLQSRLMNGARWVAGLLTIAASTMAVARYIP